ncbi:MAG: hypothetical protein IT342_13395 [Candidatus Melainabacteria bacterium]|nr:hypothetical protein [Candidatus Melainabacteria bacterium]
MAGQNPYEPSLAPINTAEARVEGETPVTEDQQQPLDYTTVMRAGNDGTQNRDVQTITGRTDISDVKDPDISKAITLADNAKSAAMLLQIRESNQPENTQIQIPDANGRPFTTTIGQLKQKLIEDLSKNSDFKGFDDPAKIRDFISQSTESALTISQQTREKYEAKSRESDTNVNARNELAKQLGFTPITREIPDGAGGKKTISSYEITRKDIDARLASTTDAAQKANLEKLKGLLTNYDSIQKERNALSAVDVTAAQLMMGGFTHKTGEQTLEGLPATRQEVVRAYELMNKAGRGNSQLEQTPQFQMAKEQSSAMYADIQLQRSKDAVLALQEADKLRVAGKPTEAQAKYEEALQKVKGVDMATITTQWQSQMKEYNTVQEKLTALGNPPSNPQEAQRLTMELQQRQQIGLQLEQIIQVGKEVKTEYARFLNEQGKPGEALPLLTSVASGTPPELLAGDTSFTEQMERAQSLGSITSGDAEKHRVLYEQAMAAKDWTTAERELGALKAASIKASEQTIQSAKDRVAVMDKRQAEIQTELADLQKNTGMDSEARALRQQQLEAEKKGYDALKKGLSEGIPAAEKAARDHAHQLRYMEGIIAYSKEDKETAHKIFKELEAEAPEIAANKDYQLEALLEDTRKKGWLERHWDTIVSVGKIVAVVGAIAVAGAVTGGVGAVALAGALGAAGVFTVGAVGHGVAQANEWKSTDNYHNWRPGQDLLMGAVGGAGGMAVQQLFAVGGLAAGGTRLAGVGAKMTAEGTTFATRAAGVGLQGVGHTMKGVQAFGGFATSKIGAPVTGVGYGFGTEAIDYARTGEFNVNDALIKSGGMTTALYGAKYFGGFGNFRGQLAYTGAMTGSDAGQGLARGKSLDQVLAAAPGDALQNFITAGAIGMVGNANAAAIANPGRFSFTQAAREGSKLQYSVNLANASGANLLAESRLAWATLSGPAAEGALAKTMPTWQKVALPVGGAGVVGGYTYLESSNYEASRTEKPWDTDNSMTRMQMNRNMELLSRQVKKPVIKQPNQP